MLSERWFGKRSPRAKQHGKKRIVDAREVVNGLRWLPSTGYQWRTIPKDMSAQSTGDFYFCRGQYDGTFAWLPHTPSVRCREKAAWEASPMAAGLRLRQKDQGQGAARPGRYAMPADGGYRICCRHPGSRWRRDARREPVRQVPSLAQAVGRRGQVRCDTQSLDCGTNHRLAEPVSTVE